MSAYEATRPVSLVTYLRNTENITPYFYDLITMLKNCHLLGEVLILSDSHFSFEVAHVPVRIISTGNMTKYMRLKKALSICKCRYILSVDNDLIFNIENIKNFIHNFINFKGHIGWGKIGVSNTGIVPSLVSIDKFFSHSILRPILWGSHVGITIPGQLFIIERGMFCDKLPPSDTFLDDLSLGLFVRKNRRTIIRQTTHQTLANEEANNNFSGLLGQRKRWALGYASLLQGANDIGSLALLIIQGAVYHLNWVLIWLILIALMLKLSLFASIAAFVTISIILAKYNIYRLMPALTYLLVFPFIHLYWLYSVFRVFYKGRFDAA